MTYLTGKLYTERGKHRLHDRLNALLIATSSIGIASKYILDGKVDLKTISFVTVECRQYPTEIRLPFVGPLETALKNLAPDEIEIDFVAKSKAQGFKLNTDVLGRVIGSVIGSLFSDFYEAYNDWLNDNISTDPYNWPSVWNFGRVVRNSTAHGGIIYFRNPNAAPVKWYNLQYDRSDNGKPVLFNDMAIGDFIALMFEMSNELDTLGAPVI
jgi:hypothetical protein